MMILVVDTMTVLDCYSAAFVALLLFSTKQMKVLFVTDGRGSRSKERERARVLAVCVR
jgi:hypothetical protein